MGNTGKKIVLTLKQVNSITFAPTGLTEPNDPSSPDYIPPSTDFVECPVSNSLACPLPIFTASGSSIGFEFSVFNSVIMNPQVSSIKVSAISSSVTIKSASFSLPNSTPNYFSGSLLSLATGSYTTTIQYLSGSSVLSTCTNTSSFSIGGGL